MSSSCTTKICITHENEDALKELCNQIHFWTSETFTESKYDKSWLGNIVIGSQIGTIDTGETTDVSCRGDLLGAKVSENMLVIETVTAWSPKLQMWRLLVDKYLPDAAMIYCAEDKGNGILSTNDPDREDCYYIDPWEDVDGVDFDAEASENTVRKILQGLLHTEEINIDTLLDLFEDSEYSNQMSIDKWEFDEIDAWD